MKDLADPDTEPAPDAPANTDLLTLVRDAEEAEATAEEAEAAAAEAKAVAAAARARARATKLRQRAEAAAAPATATATVTTVAAQTADTEAEAADIETAESDRTETAAPDAEATDAEATDSGTPAETVPLSRPARLRARLTRARRRTALVATALVLISASTAAGGFSIWHHHRLVQQDRRTAEFTAAARQGVVALTSMDFNHAKDDVQRVLDDSTGSFHDDFQGRADDFTKVVQQSQVTTEGKVDATAVESMTADSAVVLVAATSRITNSAGAQQEPRVWRLSVTVTRAGGRLLMSKVEFVP